MLFAADCFAHLLRRETASVLTSVGVGGLHDFVSIPRGVSGSGLLPPTPPAERERWGPLEGLSPRGVDTAAGVCVIFMVLHLSAGEAKVYRNLKGCVHWQVWHPVLFSKPELFLIVHHLPDHLKEISHSGIFA